MIEERQHSDINLPEASFAGGITPKLHSEDFLRISTATGQTRSYACQDQARASG